MTRQQQREEKLRKEKEFFNVFNWDETLKLCFDETSYDFSNMMNIIDYARSQNRGIKADSSYYNVHHIIPRSYFKKMKFPIDNREINLVKLTLSEHFMVHYYAWKCSKSIIRRQMASTFHLMVGRVTMGLDNAPKLSIAQLSELMIPVQKNKDKKLILDEKLSYLKTISKSNYIRFVDENHVKYKCVKCGSIEIARFAKNQQYDLCKSCMTRKVHTGMYFSDRKYPKEGIMLCACVSQQFGCFWKLISYKVSMPYANLEELKCFYEQCSELCDKVYLVKIYTDKSKEELTNYFNKHFGYRRSYTYFRNSYMKEYVIRKDNKLHFKEDYSHQEWYSLSEYARKNKEQRCPRWVFDIAVSETIKNPKFLDKLKELVELHIKINSGKDVRDFKD